MNIRFCLRALLLSACVVCLAVLRGGLATGQEKQKDKSKNTVQSLFDGIPADLRAKVQPNPVRCDRVNDWLQENVVGKGKTVEVRAEVVKVVPYRRDGNYLVHVKLMSAKLNILQDDWQVFLADFTNGIQTSRIGDIVRTDFKYNFSFEKMSQLDAEKLVDSKHVNIQGRVRNLRLSRFNSQSDAELDGFVQPRNIAIILEDIVVDGKRQSTYVPDRPFIGGGGEGGFGKKKVIP